MSTGRVRGISLTSTLMRSLLLLLLRDPNIAAARLLVERDTWESSLGWRPVVVAAAERAQGGVRQSVPQHLQAVTG